MHSLHMYTLLLLKEIVKVDFINVFLFFEIKYFFEYQINFHINNIIYINRENIYFHTNIL